jgi:SAM-dependent methyltransferase
MTRLIKAAVERVLRAVGFEPPLRFGSLRRVTPVTRSFGLDRGRPIDRYYIDSFLARHAQDIKGRVLEAGGLVNYTKRFGGDRVTQADVLYPKEGFPDATIIGDLSTGAGIPRGTYDSIVLTQVYQFIYDVASAVRHTYEALKPGGVLLATVPGISQICRYDLEQWGDYWRFTDTCARRLFGDSFGADNVEVEPHGNVLVACGFLHGLAVEDLRREELDHDDPDYPLSIGVRAVKPLN